MNRNNDEMNILGSDDGAQDMSAPGPDAGAPDPNAGGDIGAPGGIASVEVAKGPDGGYQVNVGYSAGSLQEAQDMASQFHSQMSDGSDEPAEADPNAETPEMDQDQESPEDAAPPSRGSRF